MDQETNIFLKGNIINETSPPPDAQFSDGYSASLPENKSPAVFSSSFVPDTTYVAPENNVVQTDATFQQPIENNFIDNEADDYGSPEAPIVTSFDSDNTGTNFIPVITDASKLQVCIFGRLCHSALIGNIISCYAFSTKKAFYCKDRWHHKLLLLLLKLLLLSVQIFLHCILYKRHEVCTWIAILVQSSSISTLSQFCCPHQKSNSTEILQETPSMAL